MFTILIETLSWGVVGATSAVIISAILKLENKKKMVIIFIVCAFISGCIRGYTGKSIVELVLNN